MGDGARAYDQIKLHHLEHLGDLAMADRRALASRKPQYAGIEDRVVRVAICRGAALHFCDGINGVQDFDVWSFLRRIRRSTDFSTVQSDGNELPNCRVEKCSRKVDLWAEPCPRRMKQMRFNAYNNTLSGTGLKQRGSSLERQLLLSGPQVNEGRLCALWLTLTPSPNASALTNSAGSRENTDL